MSDVSGATGESLPPTENVPSSDTTPISPRDAAQALSQYRWKRDAKEERPAPPAAPEVREEGLKQESPLKEEVTAAEADLPPPGEEQAEGAEQQEAPAPLELPRSWSKDQAEVWNGLPPATQEYLLEQDSKSTRAVRQAQNEAAESRKSIETERAALEQARQQTEQLNAQLLERTNQSIMGEFSDIKTQYDVEKMAREDWPRFSLYQAKMMELQAYQRAQSETQARAQQEFRGQADKFAKEQDAKFAEKYPDVSDKMRTTAIAYLHDIGFSDDDLAKSWNLENSWSPRDARVQEIIHDAALYRQAQKVARSKVVVKPVPTVQRPGSPAARAPEADIRNRQLEQQFDKTTSWKDAAELLIARRARR